MLYQILALIVLLCYGGIFFGKMLHQRLRGVKTNQFGGRKAPAPAAPSISFRLRVRPRSPGR